MELKLQIVIAVAVGGRTRGCAFQKDVGELDTRVVGIGHIAVDTNTASTLHLQAEEHQKQQYERSQKFHYEVMQNISSHKITIFFGIMQKKWYFCSVF